MYRWVEEMGRWKQQMSTRGTLPHYQRDGGEGGARCDSVPLGRKVIVLIHLLLARELGE